MCMKVIDTPPPAPVHRRVRTLYFFRPRFLDAAFFLEAPFFLPTHTDISGQSWGRRGGEQDRDGRNGSILFLGAAFFLEPPILVFPFLVPIHTRVPWGRGGRGVLGEKLGLN